MNSQNTDEIRHLITNWAQAVRDKDMERALAHHAEDIVMFDVPRPLQSKGLDAYRKTWNVFFDSVPGGAGSFDVSELQITADDSVAFVHGILYINGSAEPVGRLTIGLKKVAGKWMIIHEHHSYPVD